MPQFSNVTTMNDVFKKHPKPEIMQDLLETYRLKARTALQETMPTAITRLQGLIAQESDPSSPLWLGHLEEGAFVAENLRLYQPGTQPSDLGEVVQAKDIRGEVVSVKDGEGDKGVEGDKTVEPISGSIDRDNPELKQLIGEHWFEIFPKNPIQEKVLDIVRREAEALMLCLNDLRIWLSLETPIIEDGNSFGADVQSHISEEIDKQFNRANQYQNGCIRHHGDRCTQVKHWALMPNVADHAARIAGSDRVDNVLARGYLRNMLVIHGGLLSKLSKNWEKVINPKGSGGGGDAMY